ncbi:hypothetical protein GOV04_04765 [Candidatus Woesearchaeota archaeon]|nr:hypothetical protein [Candidatus Woesearchaeota archaeon]
MTKKIGRGRPAGSMVRHNIIEILYFLGHAYGYQLNKIYQELFAPVSMRLIYYHLNKGVSLGEFKVKEVKTEKGDYSWGPHAEKTFYTLGPNAKPTANKRIKEHLDKKKKK